MSHGKQAARDTRYGRRGGRWAEGDRAEVALAEIEKARKKGRADGSWPDGTPKGDRKCKVCGQPIETHGPPCDFCGRAPEHHAEGDLAAEKDGRRRMAAARQAAGRPLDEVDRRVLGTAA